MSSAQSTSTVKLMWDTNRLTYFIGIALVVALGALTAAKAYDPADATWVAVGFGLSLVLIIVGYWLREWTQANTPLHLNALITGQDLEEDIFYVKSAAPRESRALEGICMSPECDYEWDPLKGAILNCPKDGFPLFFTRFETHIYMVEEKEWPDLFPDAGPGLDIYVRHWLDWETRVKVHSGVAQKGGILFVHNHSETLLLKPLDTTAFIGPDGYRQYPTFELWGSVGGDASRDMEPFNRGWRSWIKEQKKGVTKPVTVPAIPASKGAPT